MVTPALRRAIDGAVPPGFDRRAVTIGPGVSRPYDGAEWTGALVVVAHGSIELEGRCGARLALRRGDMLWLADLPLRALHNRCGEAALLIAISRRHGGGIRPA